MNELRPIAILGTIDELDYSHASTPLWRSPSLNAAATVAAFGSTVRFVASISPSRGGDVLINALERLGIDTTLVHRTESPVLGANLPIDELFTSGCCVVDLDDARLFRFLVDLPVHTHPAAQLVGSLDRLAGMPGQVSKEILERLDGVVGTFERSSELYGATDVTEVLTRLQNVMRTANLRFAFLSGNGRRDYLVTRQKIWAASTDLQAGSDGSRTGGSLGGMALALATRASHEDNLRRCVIASRTTASELSASHSRSESDLAILVEEMDPSSD